MTRFIAVIAGLAAGLLASLSATAVEVKGLYEAEVPVTSQGAAERATAIHSALEEVLVKVNGNAGVLQRPELKPLLDQAEQWVQRYQYRAAPAVPAAPPVPSEPSATPEASVPAPAVDQSAAAAPPATPPPPGQLLWVAFDRQSINQRLAEAALPVWGMNRPRTLLWLAVEEGSERYLVGGDNRPDLQGMINDEARRRGLPLSVPLLDLQDQGSLAVADVWGDFSDVIFKASDRYQPDAVLVGRVYGVGDDQWQGRWTLYHRGSVTTWDSPVGTQDEVVETGVDGAAERFAERYALTLTPDVEDSVVLTIENVASLSDYARALKYLRSLDPVAAVQIARVEGAEVSYRLKVRGKPEALAESIGWGKTLMPVEQDGNASHAGQMAGNQGTEDSVNKEYRYRIVP